MTHCRFYIIVIVIALGVTSCLLPSDDYLFENTEQSLVIEGRITDCGKPHEVIVSKSVYGENVTDNQFVNDAIVRVLNKHTDSIVEFEFAGNGTYINSTIVPMQDEVYSLEVEFDGGLYTANDSIGIAPPISYVYTKYEDIPPYGTGYFLYFHISKDPAVIRYYKIEMAVNDSLLNNYSDLNVFEDRFFASRQTIMLPYALQLEDSVSVCVFSISETIYQYYIALSQQTTNLYSNIQPPQTNPNNNLDPTVLGYFQTSLTYRIDTVIQALLK